MARLTSRANELAAQGSSADGESVVRSATRSGREARQIAARSRVLNELTPVADALDDGTIGTGHVDAIAAGAARLNEAQREALSRQVDELVESAAITPVELFERHVRNVIDRIRHDEGLADHERQRRETRLRRWKNSTTGMYHLSGQFDPETGARLFTAIDHAANARRAAAAADPAPTEVFDEEQTDAIALADLVLGGHRAERPGITEVVVLIDAETLADGTHGQTVSEFSDGTAFPPVSARRLLCDALISVAFLNGQGEILDLGMTKRHASRAQRRALRTQYAACAFPDCHVQFDHCEIHHVVPFERLGPTDLVNLIHLCSRHHHLAHEGRWRLELDRQRTLTIWRPDGVLYQRRPHRPAYAPRHPGRRDERLMV